jgi:hypothetical protein
MLLFGVGNTPIGELLTSQLIAQELVPSAVGTIGLITAVPVTTTRAVEDAPTPVPAVRPQADPWMAFVERNPDNDR